MFDKLAAMEEKLNELSRLLADPEVIGDRKRYLNYTKSYAELSPIVEKYREYKKVMKNIEETKGILESADTDPELKALAGEELSQLEKKGEDLRNELISMLIPRDPNDKRNVILEIRAGTGGEEAALFAQEIFRMYSRYAERKGWKVSLADIHETDMGGIKESVAIIEGKGAYSFLKHEGGVHRVQRVPVTESGGRIHTSAVTVAVLPEAEDIDVKLSDKDIRIDRFCSSGPGGQSVNTTYSAVRVTHIPTGIIATCQDEKSQHKNLAKALRVLRARLYEQEQEKQKKKIAKTRKEMIGSGDRSEKVRTYNFPQGRVTDHRIGLTLYRLEGILDGDLNEIIDQLITHFQAERLKKEMGNRSL
jgi:peptide chain release factor 1